MKRAHPKRAGVPDGPGSSYIPRFDCYPLDGIVAVNRALEQVYGFTHAKERMTFFGPKPPRRLDIATGPKSSVQVVYGAMAPPSWEGGHITMSVNGAEAPLSLSVSGIVKRKFEPAIKGIVEAAKVLLQTHSIYRGQAVELDMSYVGTESFDPTHCAPRFIDVSEEVDLILNQPIQRKLDREVWNRIIHPDNFRMNKVPLKRGVLLKGVFGTGKSLTSYRTAQIAVENNWTYFYLKTADKFLSGYRLAQLYGPAVLFVEDCDAIFSGERTAEMQQLQETLDGVAAKNAEVITVFTTNFPEKINRAFLRSGRIDTEITLLPLDAEAAGRFIRLIAAKWLHPDVDLVEAGKAFADLVPADITNGINLAKTNAIGDNPEGEWDIAGKVTTEHLVLAGGDMQEKVKPMGDGKTQNDKDLEVIKNAQRILNPSVSIAETIGPRMEAVQADVKKIKKTVGA
jgi:hypothetical protein